jgi:hypothetical protein
METNRLAEAITRHVGDHKLRSANQLLQACADHPELTSQEKLDGLKSKILDGQFTTHIKASHVPIISPNEWSRKALSS